jgi:hypothetical protein
MQRLGCINAVSTFAAFKIVSIEPRGGFAATAALLQKKLRAPKSNAGSRPNDGSRRHEIQETQKQAEKTTVELRQSDRSDTRWPAKI